MLNMYTKNPKEMTKILKGCITNMPKKKIKQML